MKPKNVFCLAFLVFAWFICAPVSSQTTLILNRQSLENAVSIEIKYFGPVQVQLSDNKSKEVLFESVLNGPGIFTVNDLPSKSINHLELASFLGQPVKPQVFTYQMPFSQYANWTISQGFHGASSHGNLLNEYALDFDIPFGTPVIAARTGIVMEVIDAFPDNGKQSKAKLEHANSIRILHEDGSMAVYGHLLQDSALVKPGQWLVSGTVLAQSGNSGFTNGSHLHFVVQINTGMQLASIPFQMKSGNGIIGLEP